MKKTLCVIIAVIIALSSFAIVSCAAAPTITMSADKTNVNIGDTIVVTVKVAKGSNLAVATLDLVYDNTSFKAVSAEVPDNMEGVTNVDFATNKVRFVAVQERYIEDETVLFTVKFEVLKRGGTISIEAIEIYNIQNSLRTECTEDVNNSLKGQVVTIPCPHTEKTTTTVSNPTCTAEGKNVEKCKECGAETEIAIAMLPHDMQETVLKIPTCKEEGKKAKKCTVCGHTTDEETLPVVPHDMKDVIIEEATCGKAGKKVEKCSYCEYTTEEKEIPALVHEVKEVVVKEATCVENGKKIEKCDNCDYKGKETEIPATGHNETGWIIVKLPTKTEPGLEQKKCRTCGEVTASNEIPTTTSYKLGDVNGDGYVTAVDARMILQYVTGLIEFTSKQRLAADINKDGVVTAVDARMILQHVAGLVKI